MLETDQRLEPGMQVGDYHLKELIYEGEATRTWLADQVSVGREVIIDSLKRVVHSDAGVIATYLSDVRTKARVDHPLIGSVFEAVHEEGVCFYAREKIPGDTLEDKVLNEEKLTPKEVVHLLKQLADAHLYLETNQIAILPLRSNQLFISETGRCRMINMAVGGERDHNISTLDKAVLGENFQKILKVDEPGATRTASLLGFMADRQRDIPLTWDQIKELSDGVEKQLSEPVPTGAIGSATGKMKNPGSKNTGVILVSLCVVALIAGGAVYLMNGNKAPKKRDLGDVVLVDSEDSMPFSIDAHEVTIGEYAKFLKGLSPEMLEFIWHEELPEYKTSYFPDDWDKMYAAAKAGGKWNGLKLSLNCPVVGVDWWDARAFAASHSRRLPTQAEWNTALKSSGSTAEQIVPSSWGAVDQDSEDVTASKIYGMAGNVAEWSLNKSKPITDPMAVMKKPVLLGGSYNDDFTATTKRWLDPSGENKDARDLRRRDVGFRTVGQP